MSDAVWEVKIQGRQTDLDYVSRQIATPQFWVTKDEHDDVHLLHSTSFVSCQDAGEVLIEADKCLAVLSGVVRLARPFAEPLRSVGVAYQRRSCGRRDVYVHVLPAQLRIEARDVNLRITDGDGVAQTSPPSKTELLAQLVSSDPAVSKALRLWGAPDAGSWVGLYRLYEVIEADAGGKDKIFKLGVVSKREAERFQRSANSVTVAGDAARHGRDRFQPPSHPMSINDAKDFVKRMLQAWIDLKLV